MRLRPRQEQGCGTRKGTGLSLELVGAEFVVALASAKVRGILEAATGGAVGEAKVAFAVVIVVVVEMVGDMFVGPVD